MESGLPHTIFNGSNFDEWKTDIELVLGVKELWYLTEAAPPKVEGAELLEQQKKQCHAAGLLKLSIGKDQRALVHKLKTPHEIWELMCKTFDGKKTNRLVPLLTSLLNSQVDDEGNISIYLNKVTDLRNKIEEIDKDLIGDKLMFAIVMNKLPAAYSTFQTVYNVDDMLQTTTFIELKELILSEESKLKHHGFVGSVDSNHALASFTHRKEEAQGSKTTHGAGPIKGKKKFTGACKYCNKVGHKEKDCWVKKKASRQEKGKSTAAYSARVLSSSTGSSDRRSDWILDSGAQKHISFRKEVFDAWDQHCGTAQIILGDASKVPVKGVGTVSLGGGLLKGVYYAPQMDHNLLSAREIYKGGMKIEFLNQV